MVLHLAIKKKQNCGLSFLQNSLNRRRQISKKIKKKSNNSSYKPKACNWQSASEVPKILKIPLLTLWMIQHFLFFFLSHQNRPFTLLFCNYEHSYLYHTFFSKFLGTQNSTKSISKRKRESTAWIVKYFGSPAKSIKQWREKDWLLKNYWSTRDKRLKNQLTSEKNYVSF